MLRNLTFLFTLYLCGGVFFSFLSIKPSQVGIRYYTIHGAIYAFFLTLAFIFCYDTTVFNAFKGNTLAICNGYLSGMLLGYSLNAMQLGHWYLIQPKLSIDELKRVVLILIIILVSRVAFAAAFSFPTLDKFNTEQIFLTMRWAWGLLTPLILSVMIWKTVKIRSTQSATGILYVLDLSVITGEILSLYLFIQFGILG